MALNLGQTFSSMGVIANRQRAAEDAERQSRLNQLQVEQANRMELLRNAEQQRLLGAIPQIGAAPTAPKVNAPVQFGTPGADTRQATPAAGGAVVTPVPAQPPVQSAPLPPQGQPAPAAAPAAAPVAGVRPLSELSALPTDQLTSAEFLALPQAERARRLQLENQRRQTELDRAALLKSPAAAGDVLAGGPYNAIAQGGTWIANQIGIPRLGRALGIYDPDVTRVEIPTVGGGGATPYYDKIRQMEAANQPVTEAQLIENLKKAEAGKTQAAAKARTENVKQATEAGMAEWMLDAKGKPVRGLVNNNPGNIKATQSEAWKGATGNDGTFVQFASPEAGIRAMTLNLLSYEANGINTVRGIINRWAPETENKTGPYIKNVATALGVDADAQLNLQDPNVMRTLVTAIIKQENGKVPYSTQVLDTGIALGFNKDAAVVTAAAPNAPKLPAPSAQVASAVQANNPTATATAAATAVKVPATGGLMQGAGTIDASAQNPEIAQILATREDLRQQATNYARFGAVNESQALVNQIRAIDLGLMKNQADVGIYEGVTTGDFSRALPILSQFTGKPHQLLQRENGNYDLYIDGKVAKNGVNLDAGQVEKLIKTQVDSNYRNQLAAFQTKLAEKRFETDEEIRKETSKQVLQTAREIQKALVEGDYKVLEAKIKESKGTLVNLGENRVAYTKDGKVYIIDANDVTEIIGGKPRKVSPQAQEVAGIWSTIQTPSQSQVVVR